MDDSADAAMLHPRACSAYLAEAYTGRPVQLPNGGHVPNVMGAWPTEP